MSLAPIQALVRAALQTGPGTLAHLDARLGIVKVAIIHAALREMRAAGEVVKEGKVWRLTPDRVGRGDAA